MDFRSNVGKFLSALLLFVIVVGASFAQEKEVKGGVKDALGEPLPGVSVVVKGTTRGIETDFDGNFKLSAKVGEILSFSYIGMKTKEVRVGSSLVINVVLEEDAQELDAVVVVGFGQKRTIKELTGSVGKVGEEIANNSSGSIDKALSGKVAGVQGGMASGQPGGAALLRIRGISSINGRNNPIYIVDGVRIAQGDLTNSTPTANILANMNESDIESVTILKDAVSTAVYGADAGAGVVIITTKSGKKGDAKFSFDAQTGLTSRAVGGEEPLSTSEWLELLYARQLNTNGNPYANRESLIAALEAGSVSGQLQSFYNRRHISTDWRKETERNAALLQKFNGSVSGGTEKLTYYSSLGYYNQDGIVKNSSFNRITNANRINYKATDKLTLATDLQIGFGKMLAASDGGTYSNPILGQYLLRPIEPVRNSDGSFYYGNGRLSNGLYNSAAIQHLNYNTSASTRVLGNFQAEYKILKGLTYKFVFAPEYINIEEDEYRSPIHGGGQALGGTKSSYSSRYFNFNIQNTLSYDFTLEQKNHFSILLAQEAYRSDRRVIGGYANVVGNTFLETLDNFVVPRQTTGVRSVSSRAGYALNLHYDYDKLILLDLSGRQDALSNFWPENKTGYFWSAGVGVDFARLETLKNSNHISQLKLSASYGRVGNLTENAIPYTTYVYTNNYNDKAAAFPSGVDNKDLRWEVIHPLNIGLDLGFWKDRLTLSVAYYEKLTKDMVFDIPLPLSQGSYNVKNGNVYASKYVNVGEMKNSGIEVTLGAKIIQNEKDGFNWSFNANFSTLKNKITKLYGGQDIVVSSTRILREGEAANSFYLVDWAGVNPDTGNTIWYTKDGQITDVYNGSNRKILGSPYPNLFGGFDTKLSYKGISLDAQFSYSFGGKIYDTYGIYGLSDGRLTHIYPGYKSQLDFWTPDNRNARNPKPMPGGNNSSNEHSSRYLYKADYLRLRTIKLAYNLKSSLIENSKLKGVQIYVLGDNVWTHTFDENFKYDPDMQVNGYASFALPPLKSYSLGVNVNF
ncbi:SusC/RagA family TonB-linked outer membrane protein [Capnocytophaga catalasegens]|uniref:SusC/RagA family TonB-linked outer membrane protein n=1 Tax=Capnocytophaga catalasegens TaxID=1004260 RepID=A0AAV5AU76_9FLAO|nr:SusC/RagA family TonB-linked outer membrane protein [Capnocytophaga catalasegens]GIZ14857.1 SusC/RagA family TonB-linked outer membrane protein [Capnocytophaga catalasegens]GJM49235.1 SusC/RagA family TonB-linked outer membrane protein [Capnocytophaga catalasegens]GJM52385.1 SusC/RagA family TonB-linked outer membrane protein [Capnocytophaga catalasegens]